MHLFRGEYFRQEFRNLGEVRSLIPSNIHIMAMTATATTTTRNQVIAILGLVNPVVVAVSPDKSNISYALRQKVNIEVVFAPLVVKLSTLRDKLPRVIIFCRRCEECAQLYRFFLSSMKEKFTEPAGAPNIAMFRLVHVHRLNT